METVTTAPYVTNDQRWLALSTRDARADGEFVYSVRTTGVFSRPSCMSKPPRRENVMFFDTATEAERAGFRPCRRCNPGGRTLAEEYTEAVMRACRAIESAEVPPSLTELAAIAGFSRFHFHRVFKAVTGVTPQSYRAARRAQRVQLELSHTGTVTEAIYSSGFSSNGHFYGATSAMLGMTPTDFRSGGKGVRIVFHAVSCSLGLILVAASDKGVCAILFGDDVDALVAQLVRRFPHAGLSTGDELFTKRVADVVRLAELTMPNSDLPSDVRCTILRQLVGSAVRVA